MSAHGARRKWSVRARWLVPAAVFVLANGLAVAVWWNQTRIQRTLLQRHTDDVCVQAARRAEVYLQTLLGVAELFARRWATHETQDFSQRRFETFAKAVIAEQPGYRALGLVTSDPAAAWLTPDDGTSLRSYLQRDGAALLDEARQQRGLVLSGPIASERGENVLYAVLPAMREWKEMGLVVVELDVTEIFSELYHERIRSEFGFSIDDEAANVFRFGPDVTAVDFATGPILGARDFTVANRTWRMTVVPRPSELRASGWRANLSVPLFGLVVAAGLAGLSYQLRRRAVAVREARDNALRELAVRRKAERDLRASEARYRSVFDSASEGMIVFDLEGRIVEANEAACTIHGRSPGELDGMCIRQLIAENQQHRYDDFIDGLRMENTVLLESVNLHADGSRIAVEIRGTRFEHDEEPAILAILTDVTERKAAMRQQLRLSRQVLVAQEDERSRLSRDLHDGLGQTLTALRFELDWLQRKCNTDGSADPVSFAQAAHLVESSAQELRRMCRGLRPPLLDDLGLAPAVTQLVDEFRERGEADISLEIDFDEEEQPLSAEACLCAYRVLQEALTNVQRHARAHRVWVSLRVGRGGLALSVRDDGVGFETAAPSTHAHFGIAGMTERAGLVDGALEIRSARNEGTRVLLRLPPGHVGRGQGTQPSSPPESPNQPQEEAS